MPLISLVCARRGCRRPAALAPWPLLSLNPPALLAYSGFCACQGPASDLSPIPPGWGELPPGIGRRRPRSMVLRLDAGSRLASAGHSVGACGTRAHARGRRGRGPTLVRHGADPGEALAGVLGVPAGDVRVRDRSN